MRIDLSQEDVDFMNALTKNINPSRIYAVESMMVVGAVDEECSYDTPSTQEIEKVIYDHAHVIRYDDYNELRDSCEDIEEFKSMLSEIVEYTELRMWVPVSYHATERSAHEWIADRSKRRALVRPKVVMYSLDDNSDLCRLLSIVLKMVEGR